MMSDIERESAWEHYRDSFLIPGKFPEQIYWTVRRDFLAGYDAGARGEADRD
jgi:hypothetical protein